MTPDSAVTSSKDVPSDTLHPPLRRPDRVAPQGRKSAWAAFLMGVVVSVAANVAHTWHPAAATLKTYAALHGGSTGGWHPELGAQLAAAFYPCALLLTIELLTRVKWPSGAAWAFARFGGTGVVAAVAAVVSYRHMAGLLAAYGEDALTARIGPLAVDGLMVVASFALLAIARDRTPAAMAASDTARSVHTSRPATAAPGPSPTTDVAPDATRSGAAPTDTIRAAAAAAAETLRSTMASADTSRSVIAASRTAVDLAAPETTRADTAGRPTRGASGTELQTVVALTDAGHRDGPTSDQIRQAAQPHVPARRGSDSPLPEVSKRPSNGSRPEDGRPDRTNSATDGGTEAGAEQSAPRTPQRPDPSDLRTRAGVLLSQRPEMTGRELGRVLGVSERHGQRIATEVRRSMAVNGSGRH
ncbi:hypothetical protein GCM10023196_027670 [Actinoallomurus vinaceus]|uniref:DUF2637 domain-containing protein n=1 Tax=Actinoallomurus vinaceus TaxID=1080074 RepID=A0ABP8U9G6_9ACTN